VECGDAPAYIHSVRDYPRAHWFGRSLQMKETPVTATEALQQARTLRDRYRISDTGEVVEVPPSPRQDASSALAGEKRKASEDFEQSGAATKRVNL